MKENGISLQVHYIPVHLHPYYEKRGFKMGDFPNSEKYYNRATVWGFEEDFSAHSTD